MAEARKQSETQLGRESIAAQLAASLHQYDPLASRSESRAGRRLLVVSLLLHIAVFFALWNALLGPPIEVEETVLVRMLEPKPEPEPEPPKLRRKVLAQRRPDAQVRRFKDIAQPQVDRVKPVQVLDRAQKVEVDPLKLAEAPKKINNRKVVTQHVDPFAERPTQLQPVEVERTAQAVVQLEPTQATSGPRRMEAAGPAVSARAIDVEAPVVAQGQLSENAVEGDVEGARVASIESGTSKRFLRGEGPNAGFGAVKKDCNSDPVCLEYIELIRRRVYERWRPGPDVDPGHVLLRFRIDRGGSAHNIRVVAADEELLGDSCMIAFRHASPFPPPPREIHYLVNKSITANFRYGSDVSSGG